MPQTSAGGASNITSAGIVDNEIVNADINSAAAIDPAKISGEPYETLADVTLGVAGGQISSGTIPARTFIRLLIYVPSTATSQLLYLRFNGDTGTNYTRSFATNFAAATAQTTQSTILVDAIADTAARFATVDLINIATANKYVLGRCLRGATQDFVAGIWLNASDQITSITLNSNDNMAIGSRMRVLGMN